MSTTTPTSNELFIESLLLKKGAMVYRAANHPLRQEMLKLIHSSGKIKVTDLYVRLRLEQSVASQHLAILRRVGIVNTEREGKFIYYSVNYPRLIQVHQLAQQLTATHGSQVE